MRRTLLVGIREFRQRVKQRAFWFSTLGLPLLMIVIWAATGAFGGGPPEPQMDLAAAAEEARQGIVDEAGIVESVPAEMAETFTLYPSQEAANEALTVGEIEAYYVVPAGYRQSGDVRRVSVRLPTGPADTADAFADLLLQNVLADRDEESLARFIAEPEAIAPGNAMPWEGLPDKVLARALAEAVCKASNHAASH